MKPRIGIIANTDLNRFNMPTTMVPQAYVMSIEKAGGIPIVFPLTLDMSLLAEMADVVQGFLFPGGIDIDPSAYNEAPSKMIGVVDTDLDSFQFAVADIALAHKTPVLAICRGAQVINVVLGGTLFQDIPSQFDTPTLKHMQDSISFDTDHGVDIKSGSRLYELFGHHIPINSRHHQAIKTLGDGLVVTALAEDGVIEGAQHTNLPVDLVQWHPELMMLTNNDMLPLFRTFVNKCKTQ